VASTGTTVLRCKDNPGQTLPATVATMTNDKMNVPVVFNVQACVMIVGVDVENGPAVGPAITGKGGQMGSTARPDEAFEDTEASNSRVRRRAV
jgi:hypothetical protein